MDPFALIHADGSDMLIVWSRIHDGDILRIKHPTQREWELAAIFVNWLNETHDSLLEEVD